MEPNMRKPSHPLTEPEITRIISEYKNHPEKMQKEIAIECGVSAPTVCRIIKENDLRKYNTNHKPFVMPTSVNITSYKATGRAMHLTDTQNGSGSSVIPIIKPKPTEENIADILKTDTEYKTDRPLKKQHRLSTKCKTLDKQELEILFAANSQNDFVSSYFKSFGFDKTTISVLVKLWMCREDIREYEFEKANPVTVVEQTPNKNEGTIESCEHGVVIDNNGVLAKLNKDVSEIIKLQKEILAMQTHVFNLLGLPSSA